MPSASDLITPGRETRAQRRATLLIPRSAQPKYRCAVPTGDGEVCGKRFYEGEESKWSTHVRNCARVHEAEIHEASPRTQLPMLHDPNFWDPEWETHVRTEAIIAPDGSWTVPNTGARRHAGRP